jgi:hypothetical protein
MIRQEQGGSRLKESLALIALIAVILPTAAVGQSLSKKECKSIKAKIDNYESLRKKGGSGSQMDAWKRALRQHEEHYRKAGCKKYGKDYW